MCAFAAGRVMSQLAAYFMFRERSQKRARSRMLFGVIAFEMRKPPTGSKGGRPEIVYRLNEEQATLLMTYLKATYTHQGFTKFL